MSTPLSLDAGRFQMLELTLSIDTDYALNVAKRLRFERG